MDGCSNGGGFASFDGSTPRPAASGCAGLKSKHSAHDAFAIPYPSSLSRRVAMASSSVACCSSRRGLADELALSPSGPPPFALSAVISQGGHALSNQCTESRPVGSSIVHPSTTPSPNSARSARPASASPLLLPSSTAPPSHPL